MSCIAKPAATPVATARLLIWCKVAPAAPISIATMVHREKRLHVALAAASSYKARWFVSRQAQKKAKLAVQMLPWTGPSTWEQQL
jgi:hypothetical protein